MNVSMPSLLFEEFDMGSKKSSEAYGSALGPDWSFNLSVRGANDVFIFMNSYALSVMSFMSLIHIFTERRDRNRV